MPRPMIGIFACERGAQAVEMALVAPFFFAFLYGIVVFGLVLWTQASLHFAVEAAARCASVNSTTCGSTNAIETYALNRYYGAPLGSNPFTYSATGCGHTVTAIYNYSLSIPFYGNQTLPLSAAACFP